LEDYGYELNLQTSECHRIFKDVSLLVIGRESLSGVFDHTIGVPVNSYLK
jgi:hypothetical protein